MSQTEKPTTTRAFLAGVPAAALTTASGSLATARPFADNVLATHEQWRDQHFEPVNDLDGFFDSPELVANHETKVWKVAVASRIAIRLLSFSKPRMIEAMEKLHASSGPEGTKELLTLLHDASELTDCLLKFISAAEVRCAIALHNVYDEE
jgi:hypothetical protein